MLMLSLILSSLVTSDVSIFKLPDECCSSVSIKISAAYPMSLAVNSGSCWFQKCSFLPFMLNKTDRARLVYRFTSWSLEPNVFLWIAPQGRDAWHFYHAVFQWRVYFAFLMQNNGVEQYCNRELQLSLLINRDMFISGIGLHLAFLQLNLIGSLIIRNTDHYFCVPVLSRYGIFINLLSN